jgi:hypothetical protein
MLGCQEAQHTLRKALLLRFFIDLIKAFDMVQHLLLFDILKGMESPTP